MTAVPAAGGSRVQLICDTCGDVTNTDGCGLHDAEVVYVALGAIGWSGSPFARGPHRCPKCPTGPSVMRHSAKAPVGALLDRVNAEQACGVPVVRVTGDIDMDVADDLQAALDTALSARSNVVVDLTDAGIIDSAGLGVLVRARNAARRREGELVLAGPSRFVQTVLRTMRLHTAFRTFATLSLATVAVQERVSHSAGNQRHVDQER